MRIRILYFVQMILSYMKIYEKEILGSSYRHSLMFVHGMIYLDGQINCKKLSESWIDEVSHQRLSETLNHGEINLKEVSNIRIKKLFNESLELNKKDYILFSVDPSKFKKFKKKKTQHAKYTSDGKGVYLAHDFVMSSIIVGDTCVPFKKILYKGKEHDSKAKIHIKLANKYERMNLTEGKNLDNIAVFDGEGCNKIVLSYFHKNSYWKGFVTKFPRTRNIIIKKDEVKQKIHIREYLSGLKESDFTKYDHGFYHRLNASVPSLDFLGDVSLIVIVDNIEDIKNQANIRVLITDMNELKTDTFLEIYRKRWKQETYHQIIKDRLGCRTYKFKKLKAVMRFLEFGDISYSFLEHEKIKRNVNSVSIARNLIIDDYTADFCNKYNLPKSLKLSRKIA